MSQPHDSFFKRMLSQKKVAQEFIEYFFNPLSQKLDLKKIQTTSEEWTTKFLKKQSADIILKVPFKKRPGIVYFVIEAQANPRRDIGIKTNRYVNELHEADLEHHGKNSFYNHILPVVVDHGLKKWTFPKSVERIHEFSSNLSHVRFQWINLRTIDLSLLSHYPYLCATLGAMKESPLFAKTQLSSETLAALRELEKRGEDDIITSVIFYMEQILPEQQHPILHELLHKNFDKGTSIMRTIAQMYIDQGKQEGKQEGLQEGEAKGLQRGVTQGLKKAAGQLIQKGFPVHQVAQLLELSPEDLTESRETFTP